MHHKSKLFRASLLGGIAGLLFAGQCDRKHQKSLLAAAEQGESKLQSSIPKEGSHVSSPVLEQDYLRKLGKLKDFNPSYDKEKSINLQHNTIYEELKTQLYKLFEDKKYITKKTLKDAFKTNLTGELQGIVQKAIEGARPWHTAKRWKNSTKENVSVMQFILAAITAFHLIDKKLSNEEQVNKEVIQLAIDKVISPGRCMRGYYTIDNKKKTIALVETKDLFLGPYPAQLAEARTMMIDALAGQNKHIILREPTKSLEPNRKDALATLGRWESLELVSTPQGYHNSYKGIRKQVEEHIYNLLDQQKPRGIYKASLENIFKGQLTGELKKAVEEALTVAVPYYKIQKFRSSWEENGPITSFIVEAITACHWVELRVQEGKLNKEEDIDGPTRVVDIKRTWKCYDVYKMSKNKSSLLFYRQRPGIPWQFSRKYKKALDRAVKIMQDALRASLPPEAQE